MFAFKVAVAVVLALAGRASAVIGGVPSPAYAWHVQFAFRVGNGTLPACSGALIAPDLVLTSAMCFIGSVPDFVVVARQTRNLTALLVPKDFAGDLRNLRGNVALVRLDRPVNAKSISVSTAKITTPPSSMTLLGYGVKSVDAARGFAAALRANASDSQLVAFFNSRLQRANVTTYKCPAGAYATSGTYCLGGRAVPTACIGDVGSPLIQGSTEVLRGLVSLSGTGLCATPVLWDDVTKHRAWLAAAVPYIRSLPADASLVRV